MQSKLAYAKLADVTNERAMMAELARTYGRNLFRARQHAGKTQEQLASDLGVRQSTIARWERGERLPKDFFRMRIAEELGVDVVLLFPPPMRRAV